MAQLPFLTIDEYNAQRTLAAIEAQPSTIEIRTDCQDDWIIISIKDNGPGIAEEVYAKLFDAFFTTKPIGKGTGLGLSISYQIVVEKHGGKIDCYSQLNEGTEFVIKIPIENKYSP